MKFEESEQEGIWGAREGQRLRSVSTGSSLEYFTGCHSLGLLPPPLPTKTTPYPHLGIGDAPPIFADPSVLLSALLQPLSQ